MSTENTMTNFYVTIGAIVVTIILSAALGLLLAFPIKWAWNFCIPIIFNLPTITWGQAWCINFLSNCLIKGHSKYVNNK